MLNLFHTDQGTGRKKTTREKEADLQNADLGQGIEKIGKIRIRMTRDEIRRETLPGKS